MFLAFVQKCAVEEAVSDLNITDVVNELETKHLKSLYEQLGLKHHEVENEEKSADTTDPKSKAKKVLFKWRQMKGQAASRQRILVALEKCQCIHAMENLIGKWNNN